MKKINYLVLLLFVSSCASKYKLITVSYKWPINNEFSIRDSIITLKIPKGYKLFYSFGEHHELEQQYIYKDSSAIYITNFRVSYLNYKNIKSLGDSIADKRLEGIELKAKLAKVLGKEYKPETIVLNGQNTDGLYWKDIRSGYLSFGYVNVSVNKKTEFDKIIDSRIIQGIK